MYIAFKIIWSVIAAALVFLILLHSPKGDGLGGIGGQAQLFSSTKSAENTLNSLTWILAVSFLSLTVALSAGWIPQPIASNANTVPAINKTVPVSPTNTQQIPPTLPSSK